MDYKKCQKRRAQTVHRRCKKAKIQVSVADGTPTTKIDDVNSDCLERVFENLNLEDLLNVADSNAYLRSSAISVLNRRHKAKAVNIEAYYFRNKCDFPIQCIDDTFVIRKPLTAFKAIRLLGEQFSQLTMTEGSNYKRELCVRLMGSISEYCSESLISLTLDRSPEITGAIVKKPFTNVENLSILWCGLSLSNFNETFPNLRQLKLFHNSILNRKCIAINFNQLDTLHVDVYKRQKEGFLASDVKKTIALNPNLRCLSWLIDSDPKSWEFISQHSKQLETLELSYLPEQVQKYKGPPVSFGSVQKLRLNIGAGLKRHSSESVTVLSFNQLRECTLAGHLKDVVVLLDFAIENPTIEKLNIHVDEPYFLFICTKKFVQLAAQLPNLKELHTNRCRFLVSTAIRFLAETNSIIKWSFSSNDSILPSNDLSELKEKTAAEWNNRMDGDIVTFERKQII